MKLQHSLLPLLIILLPLFSDDAFSENSGSTDLQEIISQCDTCHGVNEEGSSNGTKLAGCKTGILKSD
ncbi:MAG: hypothetical protein ACI92E_000832 [Oceanicoccus sp.]|jgi:hypothetical protein